ncbi:MAG: aminotransferase class I/II-fold pyridoxal phosphate-dependent enzyme [Paludibacter sp.]|nr:aminotransferase class I/II-fold pyridoxal phosphate-dependent enzyme [Paludibacter sp.]
MENKGFNKKAIHTKFIKNDPYGALSMPVYHTAAFEFESAEAMELAFTGKSPDFAYARISNPTVQHYEESIRDITGALSVTALNSGMAAISNTLITLASAGSNIVTSRHLFGNTYTLFTATLAAFGVETRFCDLTDVHAVEKNIDENTCAVFLEIITNPQMEVADLEKISTITKKHHVPLIADTTIIPFCSFNAGESGVDIEIVSSTKYLSGGATSIGGLILDYGKFDWNQTKKLRILAKEHGKGAFTFKLKREIHRNLGAYMTPQVAYMQSLGLETLALRYTKSSETAGKLAELLSQQPFVKAVNYPGLKNNKYYELSKKQFGIYPGAMLTFDLASSEECFRLLNHLKLIKRATNLFDNKSLAIHPYSTIYGNFTSEARKLMHVSDKTIRLSVGLEDAEDLLQDIVGAMK